MVVFSARAKEGERDMHRHMRGTRGRGMERRPSDKSNKREHCGTHQALSSAVRIIMLVDFLVSPGESV